MVDLAEVIAELIVAHDALLPVIEGQADYTALDIQQDTRQVINDDKAVVNRRASKLDAAIKANLDLLGDGYPALPQQDADAVVLADLDAQIATLQAARSRFTEAEAVDGSISVQPA